MRAIERRDDGPSTATPVAAPSDRDLNGIADHVDALIAYIETHVRDLQRAHDAYDR